MGKKIPTTVSFNLPDGQTVTIETGKLATQADGSVVVRIGDTMLFCSVVSSTQIREGQSFFPLSVDYQEKFAAAGRIPGNFFRRETKLNDYEILTSRLVDRAIRPLFPDGYMYDTQVIINLISSDKETLPDSYAALAASAAITLSDMPFAGPISEVRVALIDGNYVINPGRTALENAKLELIVAASMDNVVMVEGEANECSEDELVEAIGHAHEAIKVQCQAQLDLAQEFGGAALETREFEATELDEELTKEVETATKSAIEEVAKGALDKKTRKDRLKEIKEALIESFTERKGEEYMEENGSMVKEAFYQVKKEVIRGILLDTGVRLDGRKSDEVRPIWTEVDYLPSTHGSAVFNRGETQALTSVTLGTKMDTMMVDQALNFGYAKFFLHYNFPALSVGETKPLRAPSRREVGHANLAGRSIKQVLPDETPYTIRVVSDILESNGSSSMATVCAASMALMDAGIKLKTPVSGIAMGMVSDGQKNIVLSDILGDEDALGDMDFKVTGTANGICACQMDIKIEGLSYDVLKEALYQAREGRLHILNKMAESISEPREDLKPHAPRIVEIEIEKSFIGAVIGPGGSIIQEIQEETNTTINIDEVDNKGIVNIASSDKASIDAALERIKRITHVPEIGDVYESKVVSIMPYGVFVDFDGQSGLLHVSEFSHSHIDKVEDVFSEGDMVKVKIIGIDKRNGKLKLSRKALLPKPEGADDDRRDRRGGGRGDNRGDRNKRRDRND